MLHLELMLLFVTIYEINISNCLTWCSN